MKNWIRDLDRTPFGKGKYSQSYQDELLEVIFANVGTKTPSPFCVEFGFNSATLSGGSGSNVARLVTDHHWDSLLLDGDYENPVINLHRHFLLSSNICEVFRRYEVPREPEYISIDLDSTDLWLFESLVQEYRAMVYSVEYNSHFPLDAAITFPNDPHERCEDDRGYGASLKALNMVASKNGYSLLWVVPRFDAFFIRNDLIDDGSGEICFPFEKWKPCTNVVFHKALNDKRRASIFMDYGVYLSSGGDITRSKQSAFPVCVKYLTESRWRKVLRKVKANVKMVMPKKQVQPTPNHGGSS